jgi:16S rRNA (guanine527-N7)-methyltransferase
MNLAPAGLERLALHYRLLVKWNRAVRLVGDTEAQTVVRRHVLESLALLPLVREPSGSLLDIGSGNGYPAIPVKCVLENLRLVMVEPTMRKSVFLQTVVRDLRLTDTTVRRARVDKPQDLSRYGRWDCITMRAVAAIPAVMAGGPAALRPAGRLLFMVGEEGRAEVLRRIQPPLQLVEELKLPESRGSYILAVGLPGSATSPTVH